MNALYLYSNVMPYTIHCVKELQKSSKVKIHIVHCKVASNTPYILPKLDDIYYYDESTLNLNQLFILFNELNPKFLFITGWINKKYLKLALEAKRKNIPVISGCDTPWRGDFRQIIAVLFSKYLIKRYFDFFLVAGERQYEYARLLGFPRNKIFKPFYAADIYAFDKKFKETLIYKRLNYPKNILFVGRLEKVKEVEFLVEAFIECNSKNWTLTLIGNGSLKKYLVDKYNHYNNIIFKEFQQPEELVEEIPNAGIFCLPSSYEPWGVVIQEFSAGGLPLLISDSCGASKSFVSNYFNGFVFKSRDYIDFKKKLLYLMELTSDELITYGERSNRLSKTINSEMYSSNFFQFLS